MTSASRQADRGRINVKSKYLVCQSDLIKFDGSDTSTFERTTENEEIAILFTIR